MSKLNKKECDAWIIDNVPLSLLDDFNYKRSLVRRDERNMKSVLEYILKSIKIESLESEAHRRQVYEFENTRSYDKKNTKY